MSTIKALAGGDACLAELTLPKLTLIKFYTTELSSKQFSELDDSQVLKLSEIDYDFYV